MSLRSVPPDLLAKIVVEFLDGEKINDPAADLAMRRFLGLVEGAPPAIDHDVARKILDEPLRVELIIEKARGRLKIDPAPKNDAKDLMLLEILNEILKAVQEGNKASFGTNMRAGAIYFIAGALSGPFASVALEKPQADFRNWYYSGHDAQNGASSSQSEAQGHNKSAATGEKQKGAANTQQQAPANDRLPLLIDSYGTAYSTQKFASEYGAQWKDVSICAKRPASAPCKDALRLTP